MEKKTPATTPASADNPETLVDECNVTTGQPQNKPMAAERVAHIGCGLWSAVSVENEEAKVSCGLANWCSPFCVFLEKG
jgi:hypothetical protein